MSSILAVHKKELSGHGSISFYIHITHTALRVMSTDVVDQQNIAVTPKDGLKTLLLNLAVTGFSEVAYSVQMPGLIDQKPITELHYITLQFNLIDKELASISELHFCVLGRSAERND